MAKRIFNNLIADLLSRGYSVRFQAKGKSMQPTIHDGEGIEVAPVEPSRVKQGDIILYRIQGSLIAHRIVGVEVVSSYPADISSEQAAGRSDRAFQCRVLSTFFILRGDASISCDKVDPRQILGKVVSVERDGRRIKLDTNRAKMLHQTRLWTSHLRRAISHQLRVFRGKDPTFSVQR